MMTAQQITLETMAPRQRRPAATQRENEPARQLTLALVIQALG